MRISDWSSDVCSSDLDRAARFVLGEPELAEAAAGPRAPQANVVGDLGKRHGERAQRGRQMDEDVVRGQGFELVARAPEREAGQLRYFRREGFAEPRRRVEPRARQCVA